MYVLGRQRLVRLLLSLCALMGASGSACTVPNPSFAPGTEAPDAWSEPSGWDLPTDDPRDGGSTPDRDADSAGPDAGTTTDAAPPTTDAAPPTTDAAPPTTDAAPPTTDTAKAAGLLAHWAFDQPPAAGSTSLVDPFGNTASLKGSLTWPEDYPPGASAGRSLAFNGADSYVDVTLAPSQRPTATGPKTVAFWFKGTDPTTTLHTMIALYNQSKQADVGLQLGLGATKLEGWPFGRSFRYLSTTIATPRDVWHHVAYTFGDGTHVLYVDGAEKDRSTTWTVKPGVLDIVKLGTWSETGASFYQGLMRDLRIYDHPLGPAEIRSLAGLPP